MTSPNRLTTTAGFLATCAVFCAALLLLANLQSISDQTNARLSALALALAGIAYAVLQIRLRPDRRTLWKRLLLAASFLFWAVDQLLPAGRLATLVGDAVVSAYVLDLFWIIQEQGAPQRAVTQPGTALPE